MTPTSLIITADRGSLKAYRVDGHPESRTEPATRAGVRFHRCAWTLSGQTDGSGRAFPRGRHGRSGRHADAMRMRSPNARGSRPKTIAASSSQLAENIADVVTKRRTEGWSFAAPASDLHVDRRFAARRRARSDRRACEVRSGEDRDRESAATFPLAAADLSVAQSSPEPCSGYEFPELNHYCLCNCLSKSPIAASKNPTRSTT